MLFFRCNHFFIIQVSKNAQQKTERKSKPEVNQFRFVFHKNSKLMFQISLETWVLCTYHCLGPEKHVEMSEMSSYKCRRKRNVLYRMYRDRIRDFTNPECRDECRLYKRYILLKSAHHQNCPEVQVALNIIITCYGHLLDLEYYLKSWSWMF